MSAAARMRLREIEAEQRKLMARTIELYKEELALLREIGIKPVAAMSRGELDLYKTVNKLAPTRGRHTHFVNFVKSSSTS